MFYYVGSNGDSPETLYFTEADAFKSECRYIDVFDERGKRVKVYKRNDNGVYEFFESPPA